jgi:hypothetical protein
MAVDRERTAEQIARIQMLIDDARRMPTARVDSKDRQEMCAQLEITLKELGVRTFLPPNASGRTP